MNVLYINGPVQNGPFTLAERPGKAVGIRTADALNTLLEVGPTPHLWNTATLAGDVRHRGAADRDTVGREMREERAIAAKYRAGEVPAGGTLTDTAPAVADLALKMTERLLQEGVLAVAPVAVRLCTRCDHMTGTVAHDCRACGHRVSRSLTRRLLVWDRPPGTPVVARDDLHARRAKPPGHLLTIAQNVPQRLILSRTRDHGISLAPLGLDGLVLDPRAGVHIAVLAAAALHGAERPVMTLTENRGERRRLRNRVSAAQRITVAVRGARAHPVRRHRVVAAAVRGPPRQSGATGAVPRLVSALVFTAHPVGHPRGTAPGPAEILAPGASGPTGDARD
ncbi:hypothetical protein [Streptomyces sp. gb14]|uniref:hypothetical protein n=1 Tax=Streptomyces sp. gb14 TaxID=1827753 RepID=UPI00211D5284|nr:hypothetical protein [Streptomyces sp. gb14]